MNVTIRNIAVDDAAAVASLSQQLGYSMSITDTARQIAEILNSNNDVAYVAVTDNKVVGWIHTFYAIRIESPSFCEIGGIVVDERQRGSGIGKILIDHIKPWCAGKKCNRLRVRSSVKRSDAHKFYLQAGFTENKEQKVFQLDL